MAILVSKSAVPTKKLRRAIVRRGFTLVELMSSLVAGVIIAGSVLALSRVSSTTLTEETRSSSTEMALRVASERIRTDIARASFMSTPNILVDQLVSRPSGASSPVTSAAATAYPAIAKLAGLHFVEGGSYIGPTDTAYTTALGSGWLAKLTAVSDAQFGSGNLQPDSIIIGGNFTTADEYIVQSILSGGACGGQEITLSTDSPAIRRLIQNADGTLKSTADALAALRDTFIPVRTNAFGGAVPQFMLRTLDDTGRSQFAVLCAGDTSVNMTAAGVITIGVVATTPIRSASSTATYGGVSGFGVGRVTVNPVQVVEYRIVRWANTLADPPTAPDRKLDLVRNWIDAKGNRVASEIIAEYAADLQFAFTVDDDTLSGASRQTELAFASSANTTWANNASAGYRPQQIRAVRFRLALRMPIVDRAGALAAPTGNYMYRYCVPPTGQTDCSTSKTYARVRTMVSEVGLPNNQRAL